MAHTGLNFAIPVTLLASGAIAVADDLDQVTLDFSGVIWRVSANVGNTGTTSAGIEYIVEKNGATDLWDGDATNKDAGYIAYDGAKYQEFDWENDAWTGYASGQLYPPSGCRVAKGDYLRLNVDTTAGGGSPADLKVTLWIKPTVD